MSKLQSPRLPISAVRLLIGVVLLVLLANFGTQGTSAEPAMSFPVVQTLPQRENENASKLMLDEPVQDLPVVNDARWSSRWTDSTPAAVAVWIVLLIVLSLAGRPLARSLFGMFPDGGQGFARILVLLVAGWIVWFCASIGVIEFRVAWAWFAVLVATTLGWLLAGSRLGSTAPAASARATWGAEGAFWFVFLLFLIFRFFNPDSWHPIWGGEKPMEFAHINALLRTPTFPAFDPWFSGGILNYYYYGEYLVAYLIKLTGIPSEIAFNLAQPTFMGLAASAMYSTVVAISGRLSRDRVDPLVAGGIGVLIFTLMGNLVSAWDLLRVLPGRPAFSFDWTWNPSRAIDGAITEFPYFTGLYADLHAHLIALPVTLLVIALGFSLATDAAKAKAALPRFLMLALCLGTLSAANSWDVPVYSVLAVATLFLWSARFCSLLKRGAVTIAVSMMVGVVAYGMFRPFHQHFVALFSEIGRVSRGTDLGQFSLHFGALLGVLGISVASSGLLSWSSVAPRWRDSAMTGFAFAVVVPIVWQLRRPWLIEHSSGSTETIVLSVLAASCLAMVLLRARADAYLAAVPVVAGVIAMAYVVAIGWPVLAIGAMLAACGTLIYFAFSDRPTAYFGVLLAAAGSVIAGVEVVFVVDDLASLADWYRMNTVFKLYYQVWTLLSLLASVAFAVLISRKSSSVTRWISTGRGFEAVTDALPAPRTTRIRAALVACSILIGLSLVYPVVATVPRLEQRFPGHPAPGTLDALDWMRYGTLDGVGGREIRFDGDLAAIHWFQENVAGTPVIAEASIGPYRGDGSRFSIALGLPVVLGWDRHERQQRYYPEIAARYRDLHDLYDSGSIARKREIIERYGISYIVVGDVERLTPNPENTSQPYASAEGIAALQSMVGTELVIAFEEKGTIVYRVVE